MKFIKKNAKYIGIVMICVFCSYLTTIATNYIFDSSDVRFDNTGTSLESVNVQDAIDETFHHVTDYNEIKTTIGNSTLTTTNQTLIGAINELNSNLGSSSSASGVTGADAFSKINTLNSKIAPSNNYTGDLDDAPEGVIYTSTGVTHTPANYAYWYVHTMKKTTDGTNGTQIAIARTGTNPPMYYRVKSGGTWTSWYELALNSNLSSLGSIESIAQTTISVENDKGVEVASITLSKGRWVVVGTADWQSNGTGYRQIAFDSDAKNPGRQNAVTTTALSDKETYQQVMKLFSFGANTIVKLYARQTSGSTINVYPYLYAIKVGI